MAEAVMGPLLGRLQELALSEVKKLVAVDDDIRSLHDKLMWMQAFLRDAGPRRRLQNNEIIRVYVRQIRDAVFDAEDAVDQYFLRVDISMLHRYSDVIIKFFTNCTTQVTVRHTLSSKIKSINTRLDGIIANKEKYIMDDEAAKTINPWKPSTIISAIAEKLDEDLEIPLVGRDDQLENLKNKLIKTTKNTTPMVISVVGKSGVGKTMLVKDMYERVPIKSHFDVQAWVSFAPNLSASNIQRLILLRLTGDACPKEELERKLSGELKEKSYLLVIDGEVSSTEWKYFLANLPTDNAKSRVVRITHTKPEDAQVRGFGHDKIELEHFDEDTTKRLFLETLFMEDRSERHNNGLISSSAAAAKDERRVKEAKKYAKLVFRVTAGLPLAVVLLSGLLRTKEYPGEWKKVFEHLKLRSKESKRLDIILSMCFDDLPHDLKSCFLYFAALPLNTLVRARTLVCMWMAEGFLRPIEGKTMEKVGENYLKELIDRRLVILPPVENAAPGDEKITVQTKVLEFLLIEAQEANFVEIHSGDDVPSLSTARRLSLQNHRDKYAALAKTLPKLRSILSNFEKEEPGNEGETKKEDKLTNAEPNSCLPGRKGNNTHHKPKDLIRKLLQVSEFLRVICLDGLEVGDELPSEIGNVLHLQYLGITSCSLQKISPSIGKLKRLQTLDVRGTKVSTLPQEFWKIQTLRHVFGSLNMPTKRVGKLEQLQTLMTVKPADVWDENYLDNMKLLRALYLRELTDQTMLSLRSVSRLKYLLILSISREKILGELFTSIKLPRLQVMVLKGELMEATPTKSPNSNLPNLTKLSLEGTKVSQGFINRLGNMPCLATLTLYQNSCRETHLVFSEGFQSLKNLTLDSDLEHIEIEGPAFPHIAVLEVFTRRGKKFCMVIKGRNDDIVKKIKIQEDKRDSIEFNYKDVPFM
ncbi:unnamed protein product [Urochloa decumbens]|uniref:Uncharacterized protein n=1 Tax=Urochloa decumbens TaxID=240449 RepID=A0ABC8ZR10_9POAL